MSALRLPADQRAAILRAWLERVTGHAKGPHQESEFAGWLTLLAEGLEGDLAARDDLHRLVALAARRWCSEGRPASSTILRMLVLEDALTLVLGPNHGLHPAVRELVRIAADAHAVGLGERLEKRHEKVLIEATPVLRFGETLIAGFLLGSMSPDNLDSLMGRLMRSAVGSGARTILLDVRGAPPDGDLFHRTLLGFLDSEVGRTRTLILSGLRDPERTRAALVALGAPLERVGFAEDAGEVISECVGAQS